MVVLHLTRGIFRVSSLVLGLSRQDAMRSFGAAPAPASGGGFTFGTPAPAPAAGGFT